MTMPDDYDTGSVIHYKYLWSWQAARGETQGRKTRPTVLAIKLRQKAGETRLILLPITTLKPPPDRPAIEVPEIEKRRAGLDTSLQMWIVYGEYNTDIIEKSYYLEPNATIGKFSRSFSDRILKALRSELGHARAVSRTR